MTVCMPVSRSEHDLERALRSVLAQGVEDLEVVITDDSGGRLRAAVDAVGDPRVRYQANAERLGFAGNHMAALDLARGRHVAILHEDDEYLPGFLARTLGVLEDDAEVGLVFTDCWVDNGHERRLRGVRLRSGRYDAFLPQVLRHDYFLPSTTLFRRELLDGARRWPETQAADLYFFIDVAEAGWPHYFLAEPLVVYREHEGQISTNDFGLRDSLVQIFGSYTFADPEVEELRRRRLAWALVSRGGVLLLQGDTRAARADLRRARETHADTLLWKRRALRAAASVPYLAARADPAWKRFRRLSGLERRHRYRH